jgi:hypothetical protein
MVYRTHKIKLVRAEYNSKHRIDNGPQIGTDCPYEMLTFS